MARRALLAPSDIDELGHVVFRVSLCGRRLASSGLRAGLAAIVD
jgi:hypothetical protein